MNQPALTKPNCMECEHNIALTPSVLRKCAVGAFSMLQSSDCKDLPYFVLEKCPKFKPPTHMTTEQHDLYDWDSTNDQVLNYLEFCIQSAQADLRRRKEWLLSLPEGGQEYQNDMLGEKVWVLPPKVKGKIGVTTYTMPKIEYPKNGISNMAMMLPTILPPQQ